MPIFPSSWRVLRHGPRAGRNQTPVRALSHVSSRLPLLVPAHAILRHGRVTPADRLCSQNKNAVPRGAVPVNFVEHHLRGRGLLCSFGTALQITAEVPSNNLTRDSNA